MRLVVKVIWVDFVSEKCVQNLVGISGRRSMVVGVRNIVNFDFGRNSVAGCELVSFGSGWGQGVGSYEEVNERSCREFLNRLKGYCAL